MTKKIMGHDEIEKYYKKMKTDIFSRKSSAMMSLAPDLDASIAFIEAENALSALKEIKQAGGAISIVRKRHITKQEFANGVAEKIREFGASAPAHKFATFVL
jgi:outer membrane receptor for ferrienterochelin and colicin